MQIPIETIKIDPPSVSIMFLVSDAPGCGVEGKSLTSMQLKERLMLECQRNISLSLSSLPGDALELSARGELQLAILIETIRRDGYELAVAPPRVLFRVENGIELEPFEELTVDCDPEYSGIVIEKLSRRKGELIRMFDVAAKARMVFVIPMRGLIGYASEFKNDTHGTGVLNHTHMKYAQNAGPIDTLATRKGALISMSSGIVSPYALSELEDRGTFFVKPGHRVYPGMVIGESAREFDVECNPCRVKVVTNVRTAIKDENIKLIPPRIMPLEEMMAYMRDDEIIEVTPDAIRLRKKILDSAKRIAMRRQKNSVTK